MTIYRGWILDVYAVPRGMQVWFINEEGVSSSFFDSWGPTFYLRSTLENQDIVQRVLASFKISFTFQITEKREFFSNQPLIVMAIRLEDPLFLSRVTKRLLEIPDVTLFNSDLDPVQSYFFEKKLFPLAFCEYEVDQGRSLLQIESKDSCWDLEYTLPPLRYAYLSLGKMSCFGNSDSLEKSNRVNPLHHKQEKFILTLGSQVGVGRNYVIDESESDLIRGLNRHIEDWDPDIILSDWGDSFIMPRLNFHAQQTGIPLVLSRDPHRSIHSQKSRSFFSYGKTHFRAGSRFLFGRLHIDTKNSFMVSNTRLEGLFEIARVSKMPLQRAARSTIGTSLSSMQHEWVIKNNYLVPLDKGQTEDFRSAEELLSSDRGGLVYEPEVGWHENVFEFDFVSMYPEIMIRNNVSAEVINCSCCSINKVPGINHHICLNRRGMVPEVIEPLVRKRSLYKELIKQGHPQSEIFKLRRDAFKWALVTCFGYLGFRNARFGKIEAHECVNAFSREALLKAKEIAESEGFHFVHAIVDSLWLKRNIVLESDLEKLKLKIEIETGLPLGFEGQYKWIRFCPSKVNKYAGVPNRYFGVFYSGEIKVRGLELRRHDTPLLIKQFQQNILALLSTAKNISDIKKMDTQLKDIFIDFQDRLQDGHVSPLDLAVTKQISCEPSQYRNATASAIAAQKLESMGTKIHAGESIQYVMVNQKSRLKEERVIPLAFVSDGFEYDQKYYLELLKKSYLSVIEN